MKAQLLKILNAALNVALIREPRIRIFCASKWRAELKKHTVNVLLRKLKYLLSLCGTRTLSSMYKCGIFKNKEVIMLVGNIIKKRRMINYPPYKQIMSEHQALHGK